MAGNGFRRQTDRYNVTQPYNVGFLNRSGDVDTDNVAVYDELQKVSTATNHMFQAIDDLHAEIGERIKALDAMNLQFDELENRVTTILETAIAEIITQLGNLSTEDIWDKSVDPPVKLDSTMAGIKVQINGQDTQIQTITGIVNDQGEEIGLIQQDISNINGSLSQYMKLSEYEATWGVNSTVNGQYAGVKLTNNGTNSSFQVTANKFIVGDGTSGNTPFTFENGRAKMDFADIKNVNITTAQIANARIQWAQIDNVSITNAQIVSLAANKITAGSMSGTNWRLTVGGDFVMGVAGASSLVMNGSNISFYDASGVLRIRIGTW